MKLLKTGVSLSLCLALNACGSKNPDLQSPPPPKETAVTVEGDKISSVSDPKVNILFVVDNSGSMKGYQAKLAKNIELFANQFFTNTRIDYRIGVVPVYDSKYLNDQTVYATSGKRKMNALGELVPLRGVDASDSKSRLFITRDTIKPGEVLKETVVIGTQWGPEAEESFSPVLAVAEEQRNTEKNGGFYQEDAYLAVIFLTDADDVTPGLSGEEFYQKLIALKGGDRSKVLIAAALPNLSNRSAECKTDGRGPIQAFPALLAVSGATFADLCSNNFGARLAQFGKNLVQRVAEQKIDLNFTPDINTLEVSYGSPETPPEDRYLIPRGPGGYYFNPNTNEVIIPASFQLPLEVKMKYGDSGVISAKAVPANLANYKNGRLKEL